LQASYDIRTVVQELLGTATMHTLTRNVVSPLDAL
jgi:site-specific recombinase XerC